MKRILVTGGAGYIGSVLVPTLLEKGHHVTVVDNFLYRQPSLATIVRHPNLEIVFGDVRDRQLMKDLLKSTDIIIPLAAIVGAPACLKDPELAQSVNRESINWLFTQVSKNQQVIMPTTNSAYGSGNAENFCDENSPLKPLSLYAKDKVEVESSLMSLENATSFRLATVFGISPRMRLDLLVNDFVSRAIFDGFIVLFEGHFKRNYIHLMDVVNVFCAAIERPASFKGEIFNVGLSSANISKIELCHEIKKFIPSFTFVDSQVGKDPDQRNYIVSNKKLENLGLTPRISLQDGIKELIKGIRMFQVKPYSNL